MKRFILSFFPIFVLCAQDTVTVVVRDQVTPLVEFEKRLVIQAFHLIGKQENKTYVPKFVPVDTVLETFLAINKSPEAPHGICLIAGITITEERKNKVAFSIPYMPVSVVIMSNDSLPKLKWESPKARLGFTWGTTQVPIVESLKKISTSEFIGYNQTDEKVRALRNGSVDFLISDQRLSVIENLYIHYVFPGTEYYGIVFPKGSELQPKFDKVLRYMKKSRYFYALVRETMGETAAIFFETKLRQMK